MGIRLINRDDHDDTTVMTFEVDGYRGWTLVNQADGHDMIITPNGELVTGYPLERKADPESGHPIARIFAYLIEYT